MYRFDKKENRLQYQQGQIDNLLKNGYQQENHKGLKIFTQDKDGKFYLKIFRDTAGHPICNYYYSKEVNRTNAIQQYKDSYDRHEAYKKEAKANPKKSTAANCAAAIREELKKVFPGIKFNVTSSNFSGGNSVDVRWNDGPTSDQVESIIGKYQYGHFNGMEDIYEHTNSRDDIPQAKYVHGSRSMSEETRALLMPHAIEIFNNHDYGCLDAGNLLHRIFYNCPIPTNATITGIKKTDCTCGSVQDFYTIEYTLPQTKKAQGEKPQVTAVPEDEVQIIEYSEKSIAVIGNFSKYYDQLIELGGKYNKFLKCGRGIIFSKSKLDEVIALLSQKPEEPKQEETYHVETKEALNELAQIGGFNPDTQKFEYLPEPATQTTPQETTLRQEVEKTIEFLAATDVKLYGHVTEGTKEAAQVQKVEIKEPAKVVYMNPKNTTQLNLF